MRMSSISTPAVIDHIDDVQRLAFPPVLADVIHDLLHRPVFTDRDVVRRHQAPDRAGLVPEQRDRLRALLVVSSDSSAW